MGQEIFDIAKAHTEAVIQPDGVADNVGWESISIGSSACRVSSAKSATLPLNLTVPGGLHWRQRGVYSLPSGGQKVYSGQNGLNVLLDGPGGSRMTWGLGDPVASDGWGSSQITMVRRLIPHIRQFIRARAGDTTVTALLENPRIGVVHLDRRGRIIGANDRARGILRQGDGLSDRDGVLRARKSADQLHLERLLADALPTSGAVAVSGSMLLGRSSGLPPLVVHVKPVAVPQPDYGARQVAALVLIVEPGSRRRIDPGLVAAALGLTQAESQVAVWLAEGKSVRDIAQATGLSENTLYWHLRGASGGIGGEISQQPWAGSASFELWGLF